MKFKYKFAKLLRTISNKIDPPIKKPLYPFDDPTYGLSLAQTVRPVERIACQHILSERAYAFMPVEDYPLIEADVYQNIAREIGTHLLQCGFIKVTKQNDHGGSIIFNAELEAVKPFR